MTTEPLPLHDEHLPALDDLVRRCRSGGAEHAVPQPHDLTWLLALPDVAANGLVWVDTGAVVAFALPRPAQGTVLLDVAPEARIRELEDAVVEHVLDVMRAGGSCATPLEVGDEWRERLLLRHGFRDVGEGVVHLERDLGDPPVLPTRPTVEPLGDGHDVYDAAAAAHRAAFGTETMTASVRRAWCAEEGYRPELDLVVREDGSIVAFSVSYLREGAVEIGPVGVVPEARGRGLARLVVDAAGHVGAALGATRIWASTATDNGPMRAVLEAAGFTPFRTTQWWERPPTG